MEVLLVTGSSVVGEGKSEYIRNRKSLAQSL